MKNLSTRIVTLIVALCMPVFAAQSGPAQDRITALIENLNAVMQDGETLGFQGRYAALEKQVQQTFDFPTIARVGLQRHWAEINLTDRQHIIDAVTRLSVANFAGRFRDNSKIRLEVQAEQAGPRGLVLVPTLIHRPDKEPINLTYVLRANDAGNPQAIDILAQGRYSELARQRAEFSAIFAKGGARAVIDALNSKADEMAAQ